MGQKWCYPPHRVQTLAENIERIEKQQQQQEAKQRKRFKISDRYLDWEEIELLSLHTIFGFLSSL